MAVEKKEVYGLAVSWLCNLKNDLIRTKGEGYGIKTGYLASARYIDTIIETLMKQQTWIAELENKLEIEKEYASAWGDFFGYTPQELTEEEQSELRKHMKIFEEKWQRKMEDERIQAEQLQQEGR
jgi:hypothetical protein